MRKTVRIMDERVCWAAWQATHLLHRRFRIIPTWDVRAQPPAGRWMLNPPRRQTIA